MANKYSRFQLPTPISMYVDPQSVNITKIKTEAYLKNKSDYDITSRSLANLKSLAISPYDQNLVQSAADKVNGDLGNIAASGNWEDATQLVMDAANTIATDPGILAAAQSAESVKAEQEYGKKVIANGGHWLDFGKHTRKNHRSYYMQDGKPVTDVYTFQGQMQHNYPAEIAKIVENLRGSTYVNKQGQLVKGISYGKADSVAEMLYDTYLSGAPGSQHLRNLVELQYDQDLPLDTRIAMAKKEITDTIKTITRQQVYEQVINPTGSSGSSRNQAGFINGVESSGLSSDPGINGTPNIAHFQIQQSINDYNNAKTNDDKVNALFKLKQSDKNLTNKIAYYIEKNGNEEMLSKYKGLKMSWDNINVDGLSVVDAKRRKLDAFKLENFTMNMVIENPEERNIDWGEVAAAGGTEALEGFLKTGAAAAIFNIIPVGGQLAWGTTTAIGTAAYTIKGISQELISQIKDYRNVRTRPMSPVPENISGKKGFWEKVGRDNELEQLIQQFDNDENFTKLNAAIGTNFTENDREWITNQVTASYHFMAENDPSSGISGDHIYKELSTNTVIDREGFKTSVNKNGKIIQDNVDTQFRRITPQGKFIWGDFYQNDKKLQKWLDGDGAKGSNKGWKENLVLKAIWPANPATNTPLMFEFDINGEVHKAFLDEGPNGDTLVQSGFVRTLSEYFGESAIYDAEVMRRLKNYDEQRYAANNKEYTLGNFIDLAVERDARNYGLDEEGITDRKRQLENRYIIDLLQQEEFAYLFDTDIAGNVIYISADKGRVPFIMKDKGLNESAFDLIQSEQREIIERIRRRINNEPFSNHIYTQFHVGSY